MIDFKNAGIITKTRLELLNLGYQPYIRNENRSRSIANAIGPVSQLVRDFKNPKLRITIIKTAVCFLIPELYTYI